MHQIIKNDSLPGQAAPQLVDQREKPKAWTTASPTRASPVPAAAPGASCRGDHPRRAGWPGAAYCIADHRQRPVAVILFCFTPHYGQFVCCSHALPVTCSSAPIVWHSFTPSSWHLRGGLCRQRRRRRAVPWGPCLGGVCAHVCLRECMRECKSGKLQRRMPCLCRGNP